MPGNLSVVRNCITLAGDIEIRLVVSRELGKPKNVVAFDETFPATSV